MRPSLRGRPAAALAVVGALAAVATGCTATPNGDGLGAWDSEPPPLGPMTVSGAPATPSPAPPPDATLAGGSGDAHQHLLLLSWGGDAIPDFLTTQLGRPLDEIRIGYIGDAASTETDDVYDTDEHARLVDDGLQVVDLPVTDRPTGAIAADLDSVDALYVGGGNTFALLAALRSEGADGLIVDRVRAGMPYIGLSAGAIVTGPSIVPTSVMDDPGAAPALGDDTGLGLVSSVIVPHAEGDIYPEAIIAATVDDYGADYPLLLLDDDKALLVDGDAVTLIDSPGA